MSALCSQILYKYFSISIEGPYGGTNMDKNRANVPEDLFTSDKYFHYIVQYVGDIQGEVSKVSGYYVTIINNQYAMISTERETDLNVDEPRFKTIEFAVQSAFFTLQQVSPIEAAKVNFLQLELPLNLTGRGVDIIIIDTGIDYLSEEFIDSRGETRIELIWDQTIPNLGKEQKIPVPYGTIYTREEIQKAIKAYREGGAPYEIVPSRDEVSHGTNMTGLIGGTGKKPEFKGVVPECNFVVIKLLEAYGYKKLYNLKINVFDISTIFTAFEFVERYIKINRKPRVVYFPLGTNLGNHKGNGVLELYIENILKNNAIAVVTGAGNQAGKGSHTSGVITAVGQRRAIDLYVAPGEQFIIVEIWVDQPNIMSLDIISPSGENTGTINPAINAIQTFSYLFEGTTIKVNYFVPEENTGDQLIRIIFYNLQSGVWTMALTGEAILDGKYNAWIPQEGLIKPETRFILSDPYGTFTNPGGSKYIITAAAYNQNNDNILNYSGVAFIEDFINVIDIAAGGVNALTVAPNNQLAIVNGTSVSAAIVAGVCSMLFQWGIVEGNYPYMYSQTIKTFLARGVSTRPGDIYPNPQWGYGMLDALKLFENII